MNPARPAAGVALCPVQALDETGARGFEFREGEARFAGLVVRNGEGGVAGYVDRCPHAGWPLGYREHDFLTTDQRFVICTGHGALFRPEDGVCVAGPCAGRALERWPVRVQGGTVETA